MLWTGWVVVLVQVLPLQNNCETSVASEIEKITQFSPLEARQIYCTSKGHCNFSDIYLRRDDFSPATFIGAAIRDQISPALADKIADSNRKVAIELNNSVFLPPSTFDDQDNFYIPTLDRSTYWQRVSDEIDSYKKDIDEFLRASRVASQYRTMMKSRFWQLFGRERGYKGKVAAEINRDSILQSIDSFTYRLQNVYGAPPETVKAVLELKQEVLKRDAANIDIGLKKLALAKKGAIAAPAIPIILYAAPFVAGAAGMGASAAGTGVFSSFSLAPVATVGTVATTSGMLALTPIAFSFVQSGVDASIDSHFSGESWAGEFQEDLALTGASALVSARKGAAIPVLNAGASGILGYATSEIPKLIYADLSLGEGIYGTVKGIQSAEEGTVNCIQLRNFLLSEASRGVPEEALNSEFASSLKFCAQAGVSFAKTLIGSITLVQSGLKKVDSADAPEPASKSLDSLGDISKALDFSLSSPIKSSEDERLKALTTSNTQAKR